MLPPKNFFRELKKVLDQYGILLVVDDIQMGFFRTGKLWSIEHFGVNPDVIVFGKALTNGLNPLSGIWAREELINPEVFPVGSTHSTFNANPMGTAVALEAMKMMGETDYEAMVMEKGAYFLKGLEELKRRYKVVGDVDGLGLAMRMEICEPHDSFTPSKAIVDRMVDEAFKADMDVDGRKYGFVLDIGGYYKNVITFAPSLHISKGEIDLALKLMDQLLHRVSKIATHDDGPHMSCATLTAGSGTDRPHVAPWSRGATRDADRCPAFCGLDLRRCGRADLLQDRRRAAARFQQRQSRAFFKGLLADWWLLAGIVTYALEL